LAGFIAFAFAAAFLGVGTAFLVALALGLSWGFYFVGSAVFVFAVLSEIYQGLTLIWNHGVRHVRTTSMRTAFREDC
jgi:hypothetical protein